jgi:hypothetical protein
MDIFLAYLLYKHHMNPTPDADWVETALAVIVLIAGLAKLASACKRL